MQSAYETVVYNPACDFVPYKNNIIKYKLKYLEHIH